MSSAPPNEVEQLAGFVGTRHVATWLTGARDPEAPVVLVAPGFARRMRHMAAVALYLAANGFRVYRCDYLDHVGLSDGDIYDFRMSAMYEAQRATIELIGQREERYPVLVAASLAYRTAIRVLTEHQGIAGLIGIVVVDTRKTLSKVFGQDYALLPIEEHPEHVEFERKRIRGDTWREDCYAADWVSLDSTIAELRTVTQPVANFCGAADDWVSIADVRRAFEGGAGGPRRLVELPYVEHELSSNPVAGQAVMREVVRVAWELSAGAVDEREPVDPSFEQIGAQMVYERALEQHLAESHQPTRSV
jgi:pimeloyl-ACP methyl ester carboxylesterase